MEVLNILSALIQFLFPGRGFILLMHQHHDEPSMMVSNLEGIDINNVLQEYLAKQQKGEIGYDHGQSLKN